MPKKTQANIGFEDKIWKAAYVLWGHITAADYWKVIAGLIFLKYIGTAFNKKYEELLKKGDGFENDPDEYCIAQFAAYEGTKGGEFYTQSSIVRTLVEILKPFSNCRVYDIYTTRLIQ